VEESVGRYPLNHPGIDRTEAPGVASATVPPARKAGDRKRWLSAATGWVVRLPRLLFISGSYLLRYKAASYRLAPAEQVQLGGKLLTEGLIKLGPLYIKLGQVLATRSDLFPEGIIIHLRKLHDDCPPTSPGYIRRSLEQTYGKPVEEVFAAFDPQPLASGSIAQVHRAELQSGLPVAIKIVKQGVRDELVNDLKLVEFVLRVLRRFPGVVRDQNLAEHFAAIHRLLISQADMAREAADQLQMYTRLAEHPFIIIPKPYPELSNQDVLVMELVGGIRGHEASRVALAPSKLAQRLQHAVYTMLYTSSIFHADPHPGNMFFTDDGKIILVDFGVVGSITEDEKWGLSSFFFACVRKEWELAVERFIHHFTENIEGILKQREQFTQEFSQLLRDHFENRTERWSTVSFMYQGRETLRKYGARYTAKFTQVAFMFLTGEGVINQVDPEIDIWVNARTFTDRLSPYLSEDLKERFDREITAQNVHSSELRARAATCLIAPTHLDRYFVPSRYPLFIRNATGSKLEDADGNVYVDLSCGYGPHILGYAHPVITDAIKRAAESGIVNALGQEAEVALAEQLVGAFPAAERAIFANSGTEAVLQAIRLCRAARRRNWVAKFEGNYHGFSDQGLVSSWFRFSGPSSSPSPIAPHGVSDTVTRDTLVLQYGTPESLKLIDEYADKLACVILEPMPTLLADYNQEFLQQLRDKCDETGIPLVFDEVVSGFRVAFGGVQTRTGVSPDLTVLGKIIGGGLPCGAVVGRQPLMDLAKSSGDPFIDYEHKTFVGGTMSGNSLSCAAGYAMISYLKDHKEIYDELERKTEWLLTELRGVARKHAIQFFIKGKASIFSMSFAHSAARTVREQGGSHYKANLALAYSMRTRGVYMPELHTMLLSAAHSEADLETVVNAFDASLEEMIEDGFFVF
jgi:glutamate-1-semialdehyde 2,1-aminomutase